VAALIAANPLALNKTALGYAEASSVLHGTTIFSGQSVDNTAVLIRYTYAGDANLDGVVNALDFNAVATNFGRSGAEWAQGDFNYDGTTSAADFVALSQNFGSTLPAPTIPAGVVAAALSAVAPEPGTFGLMAVASMGLFSRRRRV
jgi:hypothetical protein